MTMRRQRFCYSLLSQDDSSVLDSESGSIITIPYSYPETVWSQIISPQPDAFMPCCSYQYPCCELSDEQVTGVPCFGDSSIMQSSLSAFNAASHYNVENCDFINGSFICNAPYGDGIIPEIYSPHDESLTQESIGKYPLRIPTTYPVVTDYGAVTLLLRHLVRIDISPKEAVYVTNRPASCVTAINGVDDKSCIIHPNGRVFQDGEEIHMTTLDRKAKITSRGVVFTSANHCLSYLVDASGTKTAAEKFRDLNHDFSLEVFYDSIMQNDVGECHRMVNESTYNSFWNGDEVWTVGGFRIKQNKMGDIIITDNGDRYAIRSSPTTGQVTVQTFQTEITIGRYPNNYFAVRKGDKKITASLTKFNVQNGSQKAGINSSGQVALF